MEETSFDSKDYEIKKLKAEVEETKERCRELSLRYERYLNDYQSRYQLSIDDYENLRYQLEGARRQTHVIEEKYSNLIKTIKQIRRIIGLYESVYDLRKGKAQTAFSLVPFPQKASILTSRIISFVDMIIQSNPITDWKQRKKEFKQEEEKRKDLYDLIPDEYIDIYKRRIFDFLTKNIQEKTPGPIKIVLLLAKKHELLKELPSPTQIRDFFGINESRMKKLYHYEKLNIDADYREGQCFKREEVSQIEMKVIELKNEIGRYSFNF